MKTYIYQCVGKRCFGLQRGRTETTMSPADIRLATGYGHRCPMCGKPTRFVGQQEQPEQKAAS